MSISTDPGPACSVPSSGECTCAGDCESQRDGAELPRTLEDAAAVGCTITATDAPGQLGRISRLRPHVVGIERRRGSLAISFDRDADSELIDRLIEVERSCCSFLHINRDETADGPRVTFATHDVEREAALALIASTFDPAEPQERQAPTPPATIRRNKTILGGLGVACVACFLPGILAAGAVGSFAAAVGGETAMAGALVGVLGMAAVATLMRRRSRSGSAGCGC